MMKKKIFKWTFWSGVGLAVASLVGSLSLLATNPQTKTSNLPPPPRNQSLAYNQQISNDKDVPSRDSTKDLDFKLNDDKKTYAVSGFKTSATISKGYNLVIPETYLKKPVTKIADGAFSCSSSSSPQLTDHQQAHQIMTVSIPDSVTEIGVGAFYYSWIESVDFGKESKLTKIGDYAFYYCNYVESLLLPPNLTKIGVGTFYLCEKLSKVNIPKGLSEFPKNAFPQTALTDVLLPNPNVTYKLGNSSFADCYKLANFTIASPTAEFGAADDHAFRNDNQSGFNVWIDDQKKISTKLETDEGFSAGAIKKLNTSTKDFFLRNESGTSTLVCLTKAGTEATSLTIPAGVTKIGDFAFTCRSDKLKQITIKGNSTTFSDDAFWNLDKNTKFYVYSDDVKSRLSLLLGTDMAKQIVLLKSLSAGAIAAIVSSVTILSIAGLAAGILIPLRKQHKVNILNSKLTNRRIDNLAKSNEMAFKKVIEATGVLNKKMDQMRALGPTNRPGNVPPTKQRPTRSY